MQHILCPYCENTVLIPANITSGEFKHGVFIEKSNISNRKYQQNISIDKNNEIITIYDSNYNLEEEEFTESVIDQLREGFYHLEGCNEYFSLKINNDGEIYARKQGDDIREVELNIIVPQGFEAGNIINVLYDNGNRQVEILLPEQSVEGEYINIKFNLDGEVVGNLSVERRSSSSFY